MAVSVFAARFDLRRTGFISDKSLLGAATQQLSRCKRCYSDAGISVRFIGKVLVAVYVATHVKVWRLTAARAAFASGHPRRTYERKN